MTFILILLILDGDVPRSTSYDIYLSKLTRFARVSRDIGNFNTRNKGLTEKLLNPSYSLIDIIKFVKRFQNCIDISIKCLNIMSD